MMTWLRHGLEVCAALANGHKQELEDDRNGPDEADERHDKARDGNLERRRRGGHAAQDPLCKRGCGNPSSTSTYENRICPKSQIAKANQQDRHH